MTLVERLDETIAALEPIFSGDSVPELGVILGSGLGGFVSEMDVRATLRYEEIPGFPRSTVEGHAGQLVYGWLGEVPLVVMQGRFHLYEGYKASELVFPVRALIRAGVKKLVITNAAGGLGDGFVAGDLMLITDHMNFSGQNPLVGTHDKAFGERFPDMTEAYSKQLGELARSIASEQQLSLKEGVYAVLGGPSYETPAEVRALKILGAHAVGMSTVYEVVAANQMGASVLGLSLISNLAAGLSPTPLSHAEVIEVGREASGRFIRLLRGIITKLPTQGV